MQVLPWKPLAIPAALTAVHIFVRLLLPAEFAVTVSGFAAAFAWGALALWQMREAARQQDEITRLSRRNELRVRGLAELRGGLMQRSEEHTSELQSLMRISYAVFCLKKKTKNITTKHTTYNQST